MAPLTAAVLPKMPSILVQSMACAWAPAVVEAIMLQALRSLITRMAIVLCNSGTNAHMSTFGLKRGGLSVPRKTNAHHQVEVRRDRQLALSQVCATFGGATYRSPCAGLTLE